MTYALEVGECTGDPNARTRSLASRALRLMQMKTLGRTVNNSMGDWLLLRISAMMLSSAECRISSGRSAADEVELAAVVEGIIGEPRKDFEFEKTRRTPSTGHNRGRFQTLDQQHQRSSYFTH